MSSLLNHTRNPQDNLGGALNKQKIKRKKPMEKELLQKVLEVYGRYLKSLKDKDCDAERNFIAFETFSKKHVDNAINNHLVQDAYVNLLRHQNRKYGEIKPSSTVALLMKSQENVEVTVGTLQEKELEQTEFLEHKEKYFKLLDEVVTSKLTWEDFNKFRMNVTTEITSNLYMNSNVQHRLLNVINMKFEKCKWKLL